MMSRGCVALARRSVHRFLARGCRLAGMGERPVFR
jgi:hypothetical protein